MVQAPRTQVPSCRVLLRTRRSCSIPVGHRHIGRLVSFVSLPSVKAKRPTSDHTRTGFNAACELVGLLFSLNAYDEIAWFLRQGHFMRVSDVEGAYTLLPFHPSCWPFMFFRYFESPTSDAEHLYVNVCGDFGTAGLPGVFKIFFVDVVVKSLGICTRNCS